MTDVHRWDVPGRVNLIGEHLDYNGGPVLPMAINRHVTVKSRRRADRTVNVWTELPGSTKASFPVLVQPGDVTGWAAYAAGTVWSFAEAGHRLPGVDLVIESELGSGAGLSSSAAITCGIASALNHEHNLGLDLGELATLAQRAEADFVDVPVGRMDQLAVLYGRAGHAMLLEMADPSPTPEYLPTTWGDDGLELVVLATRTYHRLANSEYAVRREECERAAAELGLEHLALAGLDATVKLTDETLKARTRHVLTETARVRGAVTAIKRRSWPQLGTILTASHASLRDDFAVSCPELDISVDVALEVGALGARMTGGGFGGSAIALIEAGKVDRLREVLEARFLDRRWEKPDVFVVQAADGAHQVTN